jgi:steroid 5-alpha reductase family enzyme
VTEILFHLINYWAVMAIFMLGLWAWQLKTGDAGIADVGWAYGIAAGVLYFSLVGDGDSGRKILAACMGIGWGLRLGTYLLIDRIIKAKEEDGRYQNFRKAAGENVKRYFFLFFQAQAFVAVLFVIPLAIVSYNSEPLGRMYALAILIWIISIGGEWTADKQLAKFRMDESNKGKVCRNGLWRYSRHPNYFFEWVHWWSYVVLGWGAGYGWITLAGPCVMMLFLLKISGIPFTEQQALKTKGEEYKKYLETTNMFFPWPPKDAK